MKIVLTVIMVLVAGSEAEVDMEDLVKEIRMEMVEMKGRLALSEEKLLLTQDELKMTKEELKMANEELKMTKTELKMAKEELKSKDVQLETDMLTTKEDLKAKDVHLEREVSFLKDPPFTFACGAHSNSAGLSITSQAISYTTLLYSSSNVAGAGLDISTGVFTAGHPGSYTATWSLYSDDDHGDSQVYIHLRKNMVSIQESYHVSYYIGPDQSGVADQGGRTLVLHLDRGDTLDLYCEDCSEHIYYTTFCVALSQFDVE